MPAYIELDLITDPDALLQLGIDYLEQNLPGFVARPGNVETVLLEANSQIAGEVVDQAAQVPPAIFAYLGNSLFGVAPRDALPATGTATVTWDATVGAVMMDANTQLAVPSPTGDPVLFLTDTDLAAPAGGGDQTVTITAAAGGADGNGCRGTCELVDVIDGVTTITVSADTVGGTDAETDDEYLDRLADALSIYAPGPILPQDFAVLARQDPDVGRALAIDLYQPSTAQGGVGTPRSDPSGATNVPRCVTVAITESDGTAPPSTVMQRVFDTLDGAREVNFLVYVIPPTYTTIDVQATVTAFPGQVASDVQAAAEAMLATWLDPSTWGTDLTGSDATTWLPDTTVRVYEAVDYLNRALGVHYVNTVQIRVAGGTFATADITLPGRAPLTLPGTFTITVNVP